MINYLINLDRRKDRYENFLKTIKDTPLNDEIFIKFKAFDGSDIKNEIDRFNLKDDFIIKTLSKYKISFQRGIVGCLLSHLLVLKDIMNNDSIKDNDMVGIYEDDIYLSDKFINNYSNLKKLDFSRYNDIEFVYLGGRFTKNFDVPKNLDNIFEKTSEPNLFFRKNMKMRNANSYTGRLIKSTFSWERTTLSFLVKKSSCKKLIDIIYKSFINNTGFVYHIEPIDHIYAYSHNKIKMYDYLPHLFYSPFQVNSDVQKSANITIKI